MYDPIEEESYEESRRKAKEFYSKIGRIWCPALNDYIRFSRHGFSHLIRKGRHFRIKSEQKRRFLLLPHVEALLKSENIIVVHKKEGGAQFWALKGSFNDKRVTIIVRQIRDGNKHFFSIFEK